MSIFERVELTIGSDNLKKLNKSKVVIFGVGGVGGYVAECLVRSGVGNITIFDNDIITESNINRQIIACVENIGKDKVQAIKERLLSINPNVKVNCIKAFYLPENSNEFPLDNYNYIVDAVDTVSAKIEIIKNAKEKSIPVISCMGTGGKLSPEFLKVSDVSKTEVCPLARVMRRELKKRNISNVKVVYSTEEGIIGSRDENDKKIVPSMIFVPASAGILIASEVVKDLIKEKV